MTRVALALLLASVTACRLTAQCPDGSPPPCAGAAPAAAVRVAVLPFDVSSGDSADAFLADGFGEAIIDRLVALAPAGRLAVVSRNAVSRYQGMRPPPAAEQIGRTLGVAYVVTGSVRHAGSRLRVTVTLVRARGDRVVWSEPFERGDGDVFAVLEDIARRVAQGVVGRLAPAALTGHRTDPAAYEAFLRGNGLIATRSPGDLRRAIREYERALDVDSGFAAARARIALCYALRLEWGWEMPLGSWRDSLLARGLQAANTAVRLDSSSSDGWMALGYLRMFEHPRDFAGVLDAMQRALALDPRNAEAWHQYAGALSHLGRPRQEVFAAYQEALVIDPARSTTLNNIARSYGDLAQRPVRVLLDSVIAVSPASVLPRFDLVFDALSAGDTARARAYRAQAAALWPSDDPVGRGTMLARIDLALGDTTMALSGAHETLALLPATAPIAHTVAGRLTRIFVAVADTAATLAVIERVPAGLWRWEVLSNSPVRSLLRTSARYQRMWIENRPTGTRLEP